MSTTTKTAREWPCTAEDYHGNYSRIGNSMLADYRQSSREYCAVYVSRTKPRPEPTPEMRIGSFAHQALFEPDEFAKQRSARSVLGETTADGTPWNFRLKGHREERDCRLASWGPFLLVDDRELDAARFCRDAVLSNPVTRAWMDRPGFNEHTITWTDSETGLELKSRRDKWIPTENVLLDLKTMAVCDPASISRLIINRGLHRQAAFYVDGHHEFTGEVPQFVLLIVNKNTGEVAPYELDQDFLTLGARDNRIALRRLAESYQTNDWSAPYERQITKLRPPAWAGNDEQWEID